MRSLKPMSPRMSAFHRYANLTAVILPFVGFVAAVILLWNQYVGWTDLAIFAFMYLATGIGVTVGYHRHLTHRAFETSKPVRYALAVMGSMALEGPAIIWVADHRKHHAFADEEGDPHSPHVGHGEGIRGALHGLFHAHMGWLFQNQGRADMKRYTRDLLEDPGLRKINKWFFAFVGLGFLIPFVLGLAITGSLAGGLTALVWGGLVRIFLLHHVTWSINSVCHFFGRRRFETDDESRNVFWLALPSLGEAWHHNHHAFPTSAAHGLKWYELDPSALFIRGMERLGLVWKVVRVSEERQRSKLASAQREPVGVA
jgi:stearoyl-CoA desaturase (delta-9 desaturase)